MKKSTRFISFFLAMVMILSLFTTVASAEESENSKEIETQQSDNTTTTQPIQVEIFEDYESFDVQKAPDIITAAEIAQNGYIGRVKSHEKDLYTLVFRNSDGTNTKKIYSHPVKYVDDTGVVRDISLEIAQNKDGSFSTASHEIITTFEKNPLNGITLDYEDVSIKMVPALTGNKVPAAVRSLDNKKITYSLDSSTSYVYELTYTGYKEDIVVKKYTGQTEYMFKLYTNGLTLTKINETYCLVDSEGEVKATIGDVIIFTADERNNTFGSMTYQTVRQNQEYNITIHVDADYLRDPRTVYPIRIDPTIEIRYSNNGAGAIEDVTLNSNAGSDGSSTSLLIGKRNTYGISRVLLKVPALSFDGISHAVSITSATIGIRDIMCQSSSLDIYCHQFTGGEWTESTANWSNVNPNSYGSCLDSHTVSYANGVAQPSDHSYLFDITSLVREWYSNPSAQNMGVIFKASNTVEGASAHNHKTFGSYSSSYRPVFTLVYESVTPIVIFPSDLILREGESYTLSAGSSLSGATISWSCADSSVASCGTTSGTSATVTAQKAGTTTITATVQTSDGFAYTASCKVNVYLPDGVYYIQNMNSNLCLHVDEGGIANFTDVIQFIKYPDSVDNIYKIRQMWKIHHIVNGIYSIRPMSSLDMGLDVYNGNVDIYNIGTNDTIYDIIDDALWTIEWRSNGYVFKNNNSDNAVMQVENSSSQMLASVKTGTYSSSLNCKWALTKVVNPPSGVMLYDILNEAVITNIPTKHINIGESNTLFELDLSASAYSGSSISQTLTWSSDNPSVLTVNSSTGEITGVSAGKTTVTGTKYGEEVSFDVCVGYPDFFESMIDDGLFTADTLDNTDDGLFISTVPISTILNANGIYQLPNDASNTSSTNVLAFYDDWYIFSVINGTTTKYGLYRMREQEYDHIDGDDPGVTISFVSLNIDLFNSCLSNNTTSNLHNLYIDFEKVISTEDIVYDNTITTYFNTVAYDGSYLIAEAFVYMIAQTAIAGEIPLPEAYPGSIGKVRLDEAINDINTLNGSVICDVDYKIIWIDNPKNLSALEKCAILATHTANISLNSFAAEVQFHAEKTIEMYELMTNDIHITLDNDFRVIYNKALRSGMGISEEYGTETMLETPYYFPSSSYWEAQIAAHGVK